MDKQSVNQKIDSGKISVWKFLTLSKKKGKALGLSKGMLALLEIKEWVSSIIFAVIAVLLLINFVVRIITVDGDSMNNTLADGERLFVTAYDVRFGDSPQTGDVVICHYPGRTNKWLGIFTVKTDFVKRVVGVPGDTVERKNGITYVNGTAIDPSVFYKPQYKFVKQDDGSVKYYRSSDTDCAYPIELTDEQTYRCSFDYSYTLGEDEYFVVGDNRYNSHDSRAWNGPDLPYKTVNNASGHVGPISKSMILGRVRTVVMPFKNWRSVPNNSEYFDPRDVKDAE